MSTENLIDGSTFCLSTGWDPLKVIICTPENKSDNFYSAAIHRNNKAITNCPRTIKKQNKRDGWHST